MIACGSVRRRKVRAPQGEVPGNSRSEKSGGKRNRKHTATEGLSPVRCPRRHHPSGRVAASVGRPSGLGKVEPVRQERTGSPGNRVGQANPTWSKAK